MLCPRRNGMIMGTGLMVTKRLHDDCWCWYLQDICPDSSYQIPVRMGTQRRGIKLFVPRPKWVSLLCPDLYRPGINMSHCARVRTNDPHQMAARANVVVCSPIAQVSLANRSSHGGECTSETVNRAIKPLQCQGTLWTMNRWQLARSQHTDTLPSNGLISNRSCGY